MLEEVPILSLRSIIALELVVMADEDKISASDSIKEVDPTPEENNDKVFTDNVLVVDIVLLELRGVSLPVERLMRGVALNVNCETDSDLILLMDETEEFDKSVELPPSIPLSPLLSAEYDEGVAGCSKLVMFEESVLILSAETASTISWLELDGDAELGISESSEAFVAGCEDDPLS